MEDHIDQEKKERWPDREVLAESQESDTTVSAPLYKSWMYYSVILLAILVALDYFVRSIGADFFWVERMKYIVSYTVRGFFIMLATFVLHNRFFSDTRAEYVVTGSIGFLSGVILAIIRFSIDSTAWTFFNLFVEPIDSLLIAVAAAYIVHFLTRKPISLKAEAYE